jgi:hypothetical protein
VASIVSQVLSKEGLENSSEINSRIESSLKEAISSHQQAGAESKLGFLQKVVSLDCFFGGSQCLFQDRKSLKAGEITEYAKQKFREGNTNVETYLAQVKSQVHHNSPPQPQNVTSFAVQR